MNRAIVTRNTLDALIRAKLATLAGCTAVEALPVTWNENADGGCNWIVPGWVGESELVARCQEKLRHYLAFLEEQFDIPSQGTPAR